MIILEDYSVLEDGTELERRYSDLGFKIHKIGTDQIYDEAVDIKGSNYEYEETDILIEIVEEEEEEE